ncbi:MAG: YicC/YloC family endoribonuclease [Candidatus Omnitrophota bacterium]
MICSMTGFGQAHMEKNGERFTITLKSVNHRYFETSFHLPVTLDSLETFIRNKIQEKIKRGRLTIAISHVNESSQTVVLNEDLVKNYYSALEKLRLQLRLSGQVEVSQLVTLPGVLGLSKNELKSTEKEKLIKLALAKALKELVEMRHREGKALEADLKANIARITRHMAVIKAIVTNVIKMKKQELSCEMLESFLRSTDVSEEVTRINFHLKSFLKHVKSKEPKGKVLDFIGQEMQREINTLGAKVQEKHVAYEVVLVKNFIEKIREQVQNVE